MNEETESDTVLASRPRGDLPARVSPGAVVLDGKRFKASANERELKEWADEVLSR